MNPSKGMRTSMNSRNEPAVTVPCSVLPRPQRRRAARPGPAILAEMVRYGLVGLVNTAVGLSVIYVAMQVLHWHYAVANVVGYCLGLAISFFLNKRFTFRSSRAITPREPLLFLLVCGASYAIQMGALVVCVEVLRVDGFSAQVLAMAVYAAVGYAGNKLITFRVRASSCPADRRQNPPASC
ncbi:MAG: hypothetical protein A2177_14350 [Spirochaetes bacterium RBG_13_68_11]|nr:MAG: hypothetical protein A2177_14350 [Spirochaetes bacterium RBG_13_68_11]